MKTSLSSKRDFTPSNPNLENEVKVLLSTPVRFDKQPIPNFKKKCQFQYNQNDAKKNSMRKSLPTNSYSQKFTSRTNHSTVNWTPPDIEDDVGYSSGVRRAFDQKHKKYSEVAVRQNEQRWEDEEKYRRWKIRKDQRLTEFKNRDHDQHVVESIIQSRNDYYVTSMKNYRPPIRVKTSMIRPAPVEIRSIGKNRIYYWA